MFSGASGHLQRKQDLSADPCSCSCAFPTGNKHIQATSGARQHAQQTAHSYQANSSLSVPHHHLFPHLITPSPAKTSTALSCSHHMSSAFSRSLTASVRVPPPSEGRTAQSSMLMHATSPPWLVIGNAFPFRATGERREEMTKGKKFASTSQSTARQSGPNY